MAVQNDIQYQMSVSALQNVRGVGPGARQVKGLRGIGGNAVSSGNVVNGGNGVKDRETNFSNILDRVAQRGGAAGLKISKHAEARLHERNINLSDAQRNKIADALVKADNKGVRDALVMIDGFAVVANAKSMTVITAVGEDDLRQNIFTNIDGAVFA